MDHKFRVDRKLKTWVISCVNGNRYEVNGHNIELHNGVLSVEEYSQQNFSVVNYMRFPIHNVIYWAEKEESPEASPKPEFSQESENPGDPYTNPYPHRDPYR